MLINEHVRWIRMPLPMSLNHINLWGLGAQDNLTLVDTGMHLDDTKNAWIRFNRSRKTYRSKMLWSHTCIQTILGWLAGL